MQLRLRLRLTYPCEQTLCVCIRGVKKDEIKIADRHRASGPDGDGVITINDAFGRSNVVPDVDRYRLHMEGGRIALHPHSQCRAAPCSNRYYDHDPIAAGAEEKTIVIVLESPHKDEYLRNIGQPIAPAQGTTGSNIQGWLDDVLRSCPLLHYEVREGARVLLSNPVQFQASLVSIVDCSKQDKKNNPAWKKVRDAVWQALWFAETGEQETNNVRFPIKDCFRSRLSAYGPDYIINACTSKGGMKKMKKSVNELLKHHFCECKRYEVSHPAVWHLKASNRKLHHIP